VDDLGWLRERTDLPLLVKGILTREDAAAGAQGRRRRVIVSNHGGRQVDGSVPRSMAVEVRAELGDDATVLMDGGIRRGAMS